MASNLTVPKWNSLSYVLLHHPCSLPLLPEFLIWCHSPSVWGRNLMSLLIPLPLVLLMFPPKLCNSVLLLRQRCRHWASTPPHLQHESLARPFSWHIVSSSLRFQNIPRLAAFLEQVSVSWKRRSQAPFHAQAAMPRCWGQFSSSLLTSIEFPTSRVSTFLQLPNTYMGSYYCY